MARVCFLDLLAEVHDVLSMLYAMYTSPHSQYALSRRVTLSPARIRSYLDELVSLGIVERDGKYYVVPRPAYTISGFGELRFTPYPVLTVDPSVPFRIYVRRSQVVVV